MTEAEKMQVITEKAKKLKLLILDVDGVLTDGKLFFDHQGNEYKSFHARDGHGIKLLRQTGVEVAVISGRKSKSVALRMKNLGIEHVYQGHENKRAAFNEVIENNCVPNHKTKNRDFKAFFPLISHKTGLCTDPLSGFWYLR